MRSWMRSGLAACTILVLGGSTERAHGGEKYLGTLSANRVDPDSVSNPYGQYGSPYSNDSINNPYGRYGSPYSPDSAHNPYASSPPVIRSQGSGPPTLWGRE